MFSCGDNSLQPEAPSDDAEDEASLAEIQRSIQRQNPAFNQRSQQMPEEEESDEAVFAELLGELKPKEEQQSTASSSTMAASNMQMNQMGQMNYGSPCMIASGSHNMMQNQMMMQNMNYESLPQQTASFDTSPLSMNPYAQSSYTNPSAQTGFPTSSSGYTLQNVQSNQHIQPISDNSQVMYHGTVETNSHLQQSANLHGNVQSAPQKLSYQNMQMENISYGPGQQINQAHTTQIDLSQNQMMAQSQERPLSHMSQQQSMTMVPNQKSSSGTVMVDRMGNHVIGMNVQSSQTSSQYNSQQSTTMQNPRIMTRTQMYQIQRLPPGYNYSASQGNTMVANQSAGQRVIVRRPAQSQQAPIYAQQQNYGYAVSNDEYVQPTYRYSVEHNIQSSTGPVQLQQQQVPNIFSQSSSQMSQSPVNMHSQLHSSIQQSQQQAMPQQNQHQSASNIVTVQRSSCYQQTNVAAVGHQMPQQNSGHMMMQRQTSEGTKHTQPLKHLQTTIDVSKPYPIQPQIQPQSNNQSLLASSQQHQPLFAFSQQQQQPASSQQHPPQIASSEQHQPQHSSVQNQQQYFEMEQQSYQQLPHHNQATICAMTEDMPVLTPAILQNKEAEQVSQTTQSHVNQMISGSSIELIPSVHSQSVSYDQSRVSFTRPPPPRIIRPKPVENHHLSVTENFETPSTSSRSPISDSSTMNLENFNTRTSDSVDNKEQIAGEHCYNQIFRAEGNVCPAPISTTIAPQIQPYKVTSSWTQARSVMDPEKLKMRQNVAAAQESAVARISTPDGWKKMNEWIKAANDDSRKLKKLLKQCIQAEVPVDLLLDTNVDTPRYMSMLRKKGPSTEIRKMASQLVDMWKKTVFEKGKKKKEKLDKPKEKEKTEEEIMDADVASPELGMDGIPVPVPAITESLEVKQLKVSELLVSEVSPPSKEGRKKARVYQSRGRSTGLEGDEGEPDPKKLRRESTDEKSEKKKDGDKDEKKKEKENEKKELKKELKKLPPKRANISLSSSFMDALGPTTPTLSEMKMKKKKVVKKKPEESKTKETPKVTKKIPPLEINDPVQVILGGLFSETKPIIAPIALPKKGDSPPERPPSSKSPEENFKGWVEKIGYEKKKRKLSFADDNGKSLVDIRYFEIESGERFNVHGLTATEILARDRALESQARDEFRKHEKEEENGEILDSENEVPKWRFIRVENSAITPFDKGEVNSPAQKTEISRQKLSLPVAYFEGVTAAVENHDPPHWDCYHAPDHITKPIPLEAEEDEGQHEVQEETTFAPDLQHTPLSQTKVIPETSEAPITRSLSPTHHISVLPSNLQNLLDSLKQKGIVNDPTRSSTEPYSASALPPPGLIIPQPSATTSQRHSYAQLEDTAPSYSTSTNYPSASGGAVYAQIPSPPPGHYGHDTNRGRGGYKGSRGSFNQARTPCSFFNTTRGCHFGDKCRFSHDPLAPGETLPSRFSRAPYPRNHGPVNGPVLDAPPRQSWRGGRSDFRGRSSFDRGRGLNHWNRKGDDHDRYSPPP